MIEVFLDTSYAITLVSARDRHHETALARLAHLKEEQTALLTTRAVLLEIGNALAGARHRSAGFAFLAALEREPALDIVEVDADLYGRGLQLFRERPDKEWGLVDCISFAVMGERGVRDALTADVHFRQAGFRPLLLEPVS